MLGVLRVACQPSVFGAAGMLYSQVCSLIMQSASDLRSQHHIATSAGSHPVRACTRCGGWAFFSDVGVLH